MLRQFKKRMWFGGSLTALVVIGVWNFAPVSFSGASQPGMDPRVQETDGPVSLREDGASVAVLAEEKQPVTILFGGDMMFDRYIRTVARRQGNAFVWSSEIQALFQKVDLGVANLEGPITKEPSVSEGSRLGERANYIFTFDPSWTETLVSHNIRLVNLGNNHILNFGVAGLKETQEALAARGVRFFGDVPGAEPHFWIESIRGVKFGFVNYNQFAVGESMVRTLEDIRAVRQQADIVIVYTHWGVEYVEATEKQKQQAHVFVDTGADVIIGSHPHVVQGTEIYREKKIYYSLGNFVFDQYFHEDTRQGLLVEMSTAPVTKQLSFRDIPIELRANGQTVIQR